MVINGLRNRGSGLMTVSELLSEAVRQPVGRPWDHHLGVMSTAQPLRLLRLLLRGLLMVRLTAWLATGRDLTETVAEPLLPVPRATSPANVSM